MSNLNGFESVDINKHITNLVKADNEKTFHPTIALMDKARIPIKAYYHIDREASTASGGNMSVSSFIGKDSPVRYSKIEGMVMYGFIEDLRKRDRNDVTGYQMIKRGASYLIGGVFEPLENSFFTLTMDNEDYLYQITSVEPIQDKDKPIYRITHKAYVSNDNEKYYDIESQVVSNYQFVVENLGTEYNVLVDKGIYDTMMTRMSRIKHLQIQYLRAFYDKETSTLLCRDRSDVTKRYYSDVVVEFIRRTNCLHIPDSKVNVQLQHEIIPNDLFNYDFDDSIHARILDEKTINTNDTLYSTRIYKTGDNVFSFLDKVDYTVINLSKDSERIEIASSIDIEDNLYAKTIPYGKDSIFKKLLDNGMNVKKLNMNDLNNLRIKPYDLDSFIHMPIVIFLLLNDTESELVSRYKHTICDMLQII